MNPRHAAALALVGWYLMTPPVQLVKCWKGGWNPGLVGSAGCEARIESQAPLREWKRAQPQEFEYKTDCERAISNDCHSEAVDPVPGFVGELCNAECITTDDPRLKEK